MSRAELPKIYQLIDLIKDRTHHDSYFQNFEHSIGDESAKRCFWLAREKELQRLDHEAWGFLKNEALPCLTARNNRGHEQLISILNQARAHNFLLDSDCSDIRFIPRESKKKKKTPDLEAKLEDISIICEVKTIHISKREVGARNSDACSLTLASLEPGFFNKLTSTLNKAKAQMVSYNSTPCARHIAFIVVNFDDSLGEYKTNYYEEIDHYLAGIPVSEIEVVVFNQITCFHNAVHMKNAIVVNEAG